MSLTMKDIHADISANIMRIRREKSITQEKLAYQVDCSQAFINQIETGVKYCNVEQIYRISTALGCSVYDIVPDNQISWSEK